MDMRPALSSRRGREHAERPNRLKSSGARIVDDHRPVQPRARKIGDTSCERGRGEEKDRSDPVRMTLALVQTDGAVHVKDSHKAAFETANEQMFVGRWVVGSACRLVSLRQKFHRLSRGQGVPHSDGSVLADGAELGAEGTPGADGQHTPHMGPKDRTVANVDKDN